MVIVYVWIFLGILTFLGILAPALFIFWIAHLEDLRRRRAQIRSARY
jgi:hypothetical protein